MGFLIKNSITNEVVELNQETSVYSIVSDIKRGHHFKRRKSAENFLINDTQKILKQEGWEVISDTILSSLKEVSLTPENDVIIKASKKIDTSLNDDEKVSTYKDFDKTADLSKSFEVPNIDIVGTIRQFQIFLRKMQDYADVLSKQYTYIEYCKLDYEHKIEFDTKDLNILKRAELLTAYDNCLEQRRRIKDDILVLEKLLGGNIKDLIDGSLDKFLDDLEKRYYTPRVAPELFESTDIVQVKPKFKTDGLRDTMSEDVAQLNENFQGSYLELLSGFSPIEDCGE